MVWCVAFAARHGTAFLLRQSFSEALVQCTVRDKAGYSNQEMVLCGLSEAVPYLGSLSSSCKYCMAQFNHGCPLASRSYLLSAVHTWYLISTRLSATLHAVLATWAMDPCHGNNIVAGEATGFSNGMHTTTPHSKFSLLIWCHISTWYVLSGESRMSHRCSIKLLTAPGWLQLPEYYKFKAYSCTKNPGNCSLLITELQFPTDLTYYSAPNLGGRKCALNVF